MIKRWSTPRFTEASMKALSSEKFEKNPLADHSNSINRCFFKFSTRCFHWRSEWRRKWEPSHWRLMDGCVERLMVDGWNGGRAPFNYYRKGPCSAFFTCFVFRQINDRLLKWITADGPHMPLLPFRWNSFSEDSPGSLLTEITFH